MASKASELRELPDEELYVRIESAKEELFNLRFQLATGQLDNSSRLKDLRHDVARTLTVLRERHLEAELEAELARVDAALLEAGRIAQMDDEQAQQEGQEEDSRATPRPPPTGHGARRAPASSCPTGWTRPSSCGSTARCATACTTRRCAAAPSSPRTTRATRRTWATPSAWWRRDPSASPSAGE